MGRANIRNMYSPQRGLPDAFGKIDFKPGTEDVNTSGLKNLKWVAKIGSQELRQRHRLRRKVFIGTNNEPPRDPQARRRPQRLLASTKRPALLWQLVVPKLASGKVNDWESLGILASPTVMATASISSRAVVKSICLDVNGMANGNDGPFKGSQYVVRASCSIAASPPSAKPRPSNLARRMPTSSGFMT